MFDIGCNRGLVSLDFAHNGATKCHGCDNYEVGILTARQLFVDLRWVKPKFEVVDLSVGVDSLKGFDDKYDIIVMLATYHKIKRIMPEKLLNALTVEIGRRTGELFVWRGAEEELKALDRDLGTSGLKRVQTSYLSKEIGPAAIWRRNG